MNGLTISHTFAACIVTHAIGPFRTVIQVTYFKAALGNLRLAEAVSEQVWGNTDVLLAHADGQIIIVGLDQAGFRIDSGTGRQQDEKDQITLHVTSISH